MFDVGRSKRAEQAFAFDDITIVPSRRTRGEEEVSLHWRIDAYTFDFPLLAAPMDSVVSPATAIRDRSVGWSWCAQPRGHLDSLRRPAAAAGRDHREQGCHRGDPPDAADLRRTDQV